MVVLRAFRVAAQVVGKVTLVRVVEITEQSGEVAVVTQHVQKCFARQLGEIVGRRVTLLVTVVIAVVHLQENTLLPYSSASATAASASVAASAATEVAESETVGLRSVFGLWFGLEDIERLSITESDLVAPVV